jgi:hypothetical protein
MTPAQSAVLFAAVFAAALLVGAAALLVVERLLAERRDRLRLHRSTPATHDRLSEHGHAIARHDDLLAAHGRRLNDIDSKVLRLDLGQLPARWTELPLVSDGGPINGRTDYEAMATAYEAMATAYNVTVQP